MGKIQTNDHQRLQTMEFLKISVTFISWLQCKSRAKRRGSKRMLQGTVSSTMKVTVSCLLTNPILPQGPCSVLTGPFCQWVVVGEIPESLLLPFYLCHLDQSTPSLPVLLDKFFGTLFVIPLNPPTAICFHFPQSFQVPFGSSKPSSGSPFVRFPLYQS